MLVSLVEFREFGQAVQRGTSAGLRRYCTTCQTALSGVCCCLGGDRKRRFQVHWSTGRIEYRPLQRGLGTERPTDWRSDQPRMCEDPMKAASCEAVQLASQRLRRRASTPPRSCEACRPDPPWQPIAAKPFPVVSWLLDCQSTPAVADRSRQCGSLPF